ncbi:MAG: AAA family ATPase [Actinobacteria bacterium]|nr:AAA family ATPase [Actinomycetota bacterium]
MPDPATRRAEREPLRVRLLGPFSVTRRDRVLTGRELGSRKGRTLLKLLIVERPRTVSADRVAEVLWGDPPDRHQRVIAQLVSRLRAALGKEALEGGPDGYRISPQCFEVDLDEAARFIEEAEGRAAKEPALAAIAASAALEILQRGVVLENEPYADWVEPARSEARNLLRRARRSGWIAALESGNHQSAIGFARTASEDDELDEEAWRALMTAYHGSGRTAIAIDLYDRLRTHLSEDLGVDPAPETQALHLRMLRNQPLPELDAPAAAIDKSFDPSFVGRAEELEWLVSRWEEAARAAPSFTLIVGEAGIGKTRLASEVAEVVRTTGGRVVQARCYEAERSLFLQPLADVVRSLALTGDPDTLRELAGEWAPNLSALVPEIDLVLRPHSYQPATPEIERRRTFEAIADLVRRTSLRTPLMLLLDDLHNAGSSTLEWLHFGFRRLSGARVLFLATLRADEGHEAETHLHDIAERRDLGPLSKDAVAQLAAAAGAPDLTQRILARTSGHTLFVVETLRALAEGADQSEVPESLLAAVLGRVERTGAECEELLRVGAVFGSAFELPLVAQMLDIAPEEAASSARRALEARLLMESGSLFEFANDLIRDALYRTTPGPILIARHRRAATLLEGRPESVATHARAAGEFALAANAWLEAGEHALARYANRDAQRMIEGSLEAATLAHDSRTEARALLLRGQAREALADFEGAFEDHRAALALSHDIGERALEISVLRGLGGDILVGLGRPSAECIPFLEDALALAEETGDPSAEASVLSRLAVIATNKLKFTDAYRYARRAVEQARSLNDERGLGFALDGLKTAAAYSGNIEVLQPVLYELESILRRQGNLWYLQWTVFESSFIPLARAQWQAASDRIEAALEINARTGYEAYQGAFRAHLGWINRSRGDQEGALREGELAARLAGDVGHPWWIALAEVMLGWTLTEVGESRRAIEHLRTALDAAERDGSEAYLVRALSHLGLALWLEGKSDEAETCMIKAEDLLDGVDVPPDEAFLHGAHSYFALARLRLARAERRAAEALVRIVRDPSEKMGWVEVTAEADLLLGISRQDDRLVKSVVDQAGARGLSRLQQLGEQGGGPGGSV